MLYSFLHGGSFVEGSATMRAKILFRVSCFSDERKAAGKENKHFVRVISETEFCIKINV